MRESCELKFLSVLSDLSRMQLPCLEEGGVAPAHGPPRFPSGQMEDGQYFTVVLFQSAHDIHWRGVEFLHPLSDEVGVTLR